jgi:small subunit ribosomal protein S6e
MPQFKLVISDPKTAKAEVLEVKDASAQVLVGRKIGDIVDASTIGYSGKIQITGGSDKAGFPMRADVMGGGKNYVLLSRGVGYRSTEGGSKKRKLVRGNTITEEVYQINAKKSEGADVPSPAAPGAAKKV